MDPSDHPVGIPVIHVATAMRRGWQRCGDCDYALHKPDDLRTLPGFGSGTEVVVLLNPPYRTTWRYGTPPGTDVLRHADEIAKICTEV